MRTQATTSASRVIYGRAGSAPSVVAGYIVSPEVSGDCCSTEMRKLGDVRYEGDWPYFFKRCRVCGFTVRRLLPFTVADESARLVPFKNKWGKIGV